MRALTGAALLLCLAGVPAGAAEPASDVPDTVPALGVALAFLDAGGTVLAAPPADRAVRVRVTLTDALTGQAATDRRIEAWIRPADPAAPTCAAAVRAFRATRAIPGAAIDLNGVLLATVNRDATIHVATPRTGLGAARLAAAHALPEPPAAVAVDPVGLRLVVALPEAGEVRALSALSSASVTLVRGVPGAGALEPVADGGFWLAAEGRVSRHDADGAERGRFAVAGTPRLAALRRPDPTGYGPPALAALVAFTASGEVVPLDPGAGGVGQRLAEPPLADAAPLGGGALLTLPSDEGADEGAGGGDGVARLRYADDPERVETIALPAPATRLAVHPGGRYALAWTPGRAEMAAIDVARGTARAVRPPRGGTVAAAIATAEGAVALSLDGGLVQRIDLGLAAAAPDYDPPTVNLGGASPEPLPGEGPLLATLAPSPQALALDPARRLAWLVDARPVAETPPMESVPLNSGAPSGLHVLDRSFRRVAPGVYETAVLLPPGPQELVLTAAGEGFSRCLPVAVAGVARQRLVTPLRIALAGDGRFTPGAPGTVALRLEDAEGRDRTPERLELLLAALTSSDRQVVAATRGADGALRVQATFPVAGIYAIQPLRLPPGFALRATPVVEVGP